MDLDFAIMRGAVRRWRLAAALVLLFVPGAMGVYVEVTTEHVSRKAERVLESVAQRMTPSPVAAPPSSRTD